LPWTDQANQAGDLATTRKNHKKRKEENRNEKKNEGIQKEKD
jgi:hypothetical protein